MKKLIVLVSLLLGIAGTVHAAGPNWVAGNITSYTSTTDGLMLMIDNGVPTNWTGTPYGWMLIPEANKTMIAMALAALTTGNKNVVIYTAGFPGPTGFCVVNQFQPTGF